MHHVAVDARDVVAVGGHGVEMTAEHDAPLATELGADDHVVGDAGDVEAGGARHEACLDQVGEMSLVVALRRHVDQGGCEREEVVGGRADHAFVAHVAAPWVRSTSLSAALS